MQFKTKNLAIAILISLGVAACSSGKNDSPGISVEENQSYQAVSTIKASGSVAENFSQQAEAAANSAEAAATSAQKASTEQAAQRALDQAKSALQSATNAQQEITKQQEKATPELNKALKVNSQIGDTLKQIEQAKANADQAVAKAQAAVERAQQAFNQLQEKLKQQAEQAKAEKEAAEKAQKEAEEQAAKEAADKAEAERLAAEKAAKEAAEKAEKERQAAEQVAFQLATTAYSAARTDSVAQDYKTFEKRAALLAEIKGQQKNTEKDGTSCATGSSKSPADCFAGSNGVEGKSKGTLLAYYGQAYSGYAVIREEYSNLRPTENTGDANAYLALADENNLTKDKAAVTNATYNGRASYSKDGNAVVFSDKVQMTVKDDQISGYVYRNKTVRGKEITETYAEFQQGQINAENGRVTFNGNALINMSPGQNEGSTPMAAKNIDKNQAGHYQGTFVGAQAQEMVGTFETTEDNSVRGAFAASK